MKVKLHLVCTNTEGYLKGNYNHVFTFLDHSCLPDDWVSCGWMEIDVEIDVENAIGIASKIIDRDMGKLTAAMNVLEQRKKELLAITYQPEEKYKDGIYPEYSDEKCPAEESLTELADRENRILDAQERRS